MKGPAFRLVLFVLLSAMAFCSKETPTGAGTSGLPVADNGGLLVKYPNGGEAFHTGDQITIRYGYVPGEESEIEGLDGQMDLLLDDTVFLKSIVRSLSCTQESTAVWTVPESLWIRDQPTGDFVRKPFPTGNRFKLKYYDYDLQYSRTDISDNYFSIVKN